MYRQQIDPTKNNTIDSTIDYKRNFVTATEKDTERILCHKGQNTL